MKFSINKEPDKYMAFEKKNPTQALTFKLHSTASHDFIYNAIHSDFYMHVQRSLYITTLLLY